MTWPKKKLETLALCAIACGLGLASVAAEQPPLPDPAKFHVYLLTGQSNMAGRGELTPSNRVATVRVLKMDKEGRWVPAEEPIHFDVPFAGAGLGASFARAMADAESDVTIGLVPCAVGGSPMWRWDPGTMYYTNTIARARAAMKVGTLKGILWHQGCSEANVETNAFGYAERVAKMMRSFRKDLGAPDVPIVAGELGWFLDDVVGYKPSKYWRQVNTEINLLPRLLEKCAVVSSEGLTANADNLHFNTPSQRAFGLRYAKAMRRLQTGCLRIGVIGCDTSHAVEFAENPAFNVVCAYKWGSRDIFSSTNRYPAYIARMRELGVTMVDSIPELLAKCDAVLLETNDGRPHLEQATEVFRSGKPVFIDKPLAGSWEDCVKIYAAAKAAKATFFSGSALHYNSNAVAVARGDFGAVRGAVAWSPDNFEPTQQEYFWYGVHGVELLFGALGPGCEKVSCTRTEEGDAITGVWSDGRIGIVKLNNVARKVNAGGFGGRAFTAKGVIDLGGWESYQGLENDILAYFKTGRPPRTLDEQLEIYAFMEAARRSQAEGGRQVAVPKP